ncbi:MAG: aminotransferase class IV [Opitutaceae bacterium]|jgi:branched-chain amino acid aminotransferase|nr:aminotransferase class IV [Opitutaceae bacterium]
MSKHIQANTSGRLHPASEPSISPLNRGFLYGDAVYEVWRTYHGVIFGWEEHWARLERSAAALHMPPLFSRAEILGEIKKTVAEFRRHVPGTGDVYIRLQITRGGGDIGLDTALATSPVFIILVQENTLYPAEKFRAGLRLSLARDHRRNAREALNPAWKTGNYLNNILCLREARQRGADEVVILNPAGEVAEAAVCNIAFVRDGAVLTPPAGAGILAGITRGILLDEIAPALGIPAREERITPGDLARMDECFLLSTTKDLTPVASIDEHHYKLDDARSVTLKLKQGFAGCARARAAAHPELSVY